MAKPQRVNPEKQAQRKHEQAMKKLENKGQSGYAARKMEAQRERQKTVRVAAVANAARDALKNRQGALNSWNALINGEDLQAGQQQGSITDNTKRESSEKEDKYQ